MSKRHVLTSFTANITGAGDWDAALKKAHNFLDQLTLGEKAGIVTGMQTTTLAFPRRSLP
jgi:hypothetical protein